MPDSDTPLMVVPSRSQLQAGAVWITIANWADGLRERYGDVEIRTADGSVTPEHARTEAFSDRPIAPRSTRQRLPTLRVLAKDLRWAWRGVRRVVGDARHPVPDPKSVPFVWQHHDLFQYSGLVLARRAGIPFVLFVDAPIVWEARKWAVRRPGWSTLVEWLGERIVLRRADVVLCVSDAVADQTVEMGVDAANVMVTPCSALPPDPPPDRAACRAELGVDHRFVVGWVGSFRPFHALDTLLDALDDERVRAIDPVVVLVGDGVERQRIVERLTALGIDHRCPGSLPHDQVYRHIAAFDCGIVTASPGDDFHYSPLKLKEYMAMSTPVIVPAVGEMDHALDDGVNAVKYDPGDADGLAAAIVRAASDDAIRDELGRGGRRAFEARFSQIAQVDALHERLVGLRSVSR